MRNGSTEAAGIKSVEILAKLLVGCILCLGLLNAGSPQRALSQEAGSLGDRIKSQEKELRRIQREIQQHREKSKELKQEETNVLRRLSTLEKEIDLSEKLLKQLEQRETLLTEQIDSLRVRVTWERSVLKEREAKLRGRLRRLYMQEPHYRWEMLLGSESIHVMLQRYKYLKLVAERDAGLLTEVRERKAALEHEQATLTETLVDVATLKATQAEEGGQLKDKKTARLAMLRRIRNEKSRHERMIQDLKKAQTDLQNLIGELEERRQEEAQRLRDIGDFTKLKGNLLRPVEGKIIRAFGKYRHPKFGTVTFNSGIDIQARPGTPIRAVATGIVEFMDWIAGYGKCVILNHGNGYYTLYAHVAELFVEQGQNVNSGDVIAEVGDSGSLEGFTCHFEIRKSKEALNPAEWFAK